MRIWIVALVSILACASARAESSGVTFNYRGEDIHKVIEDFAKASGQKFIFEPSVHGTVTIVNNGPVSIQEAFNQLSVALALNDLGISLQDDVMVVMQARELQRNYIEVVTELPPLKPQRMYTWVVSLKHASAEDVNHQLRVLTSKDGELAAYVPTNQLIISDWSTNLQRIAKILKEVDIPPSVPTPPPVKKAKESMTDKDAKTEKHPKPKSDKK